MKKSVSSILLASALLLGSIAPVVANAATTGTGTTSSEITFSKPDSVTEPVDPDKPTVPSTGDNGGTEPSGDLTFLYVSPKMQFGIKGEDGTINLNNPIETTSAAKTYNPLVTTRALGTVAENTKLVTEVSDTRGTNAGWSVSVSADPMMSGSNQLTGATLDLQGNAATINNSAFDDYKDAGITGEDATLPTDSTSKTIFNAADGSGVLTTTFQIDPDNITLTNIPANVKAGTYAGDVNWTLSDTPVK